MPSDVSVEALARRGTQVELNARDGVSQFKRCGPQVQPFLPDIVDVACVQVVAEDWVSKMSQMSANLMGPACLWPASDPGEPREQVTACVLLWADSCARSATLDWLFHYVLFGEATDRHGDVLFTHLTALEGLSQADVGACCLRDSVLFV